MKDQTTLTSPLGEEELLQTQLNEVRLQTYSKPSVQLRDLPTSTAMLSAPKERKMRREKWVKRSF